MENERDVTQQQLNEVIRRMDRMQNEMSDMRNWLPVLFARLSLQSLSISEWLGIIFRIWVASLVFVFLTFIVLVIASAVFGGIFTTLLWGATRRY